MKIQVFIAITLLIILCFVYCDLKEPNSPQIGNLTISLIFPKEPGLRLKKATITIDRVHIKIINSSNQTIVDDFLTKSDSVFKGSFEVPTGSGYRVEVKCYQSSVWIYQGNSSNVSVQPGKTTPVDIHLTSTVLAVKIYPSSITLLPNGIQQFKDYGFFPPNNDSIEVTTESTWSANPSNAGSFSSSGLFKASDTYTGNATISANYSSKQGTIAVNIIPDSIELIVDPESWDYDTVKVGQSSAKTFTITNSSSSTATLNVTNQSIIGTNASEFSIVSGDGSFNLAPGQSHITTIRFSPQSSGPKSATLRINNNSYNAPTKDVPLGGVGGNIIIEVNPESWIYDTVKVGQSSEKVITITNSSSSSANLSVTSQSITGPDSSEFSIASGGGSFSLSPGQSHSTTIRFSPQQPSGTKNATFRIDNNSDNAPIKDIPITGSVVSGDIIIEVNPEPCGLDTVRVGQSSEKEISIKNSSSSSANLSVTSQSIIGTHASEIDIVRGGGSFSLSPGELHATTIKFSPTTTGSKFASLRIVNNSNNAPNKEIDLYGACEEVTIEVEPESWDYGTITVGQSSDKSFTIKNLSPWSVNLNVTSQSITGLDSSEFSIVGGGGSFILLPGHSQKTTIRFNPKTSGPKSATFRIENNSDNAPTKDVPLIGVGGNIIIEVNPESWVYDTVRVGQNSNKSYTIKNSSSSTATLSVTNQSIIGTHASEFSIISGSGSFSLTPGQSHATTIRFSPQTSGTKSAKFRIVNNSNNAPIKELPLSGYGFEFEMIYIHAGEFTMGSNAGASDEQPVHTVYLDAYYIDKYEVTNSQYAEYLNAALALGEIQVYDKTVYKSEAPLLYMYAEISYDGIQFHVEQGKEFYPVVKVTWYGASAYAEHYGKRLPTEAEWEKAARGSDERKYPWGNTEPTPLHCNYNSSHTTQVGQYSPNGDSPYGCSDMAGNVYEWCSDWYNRDYYTDSPYSNPQGPSAGDSRVSRGSCYGSTENSLRCANRYDESPENGDGWTGFRCAR